MAKMENPSMSRRVEKSPDAGAKIKEAEAVFEGLASRLDALYGKDELTPAEQREVDLIYNNAMIVAEEVAGKTPKEFRS